MFGLLLLAFCSVGSVVSLNFEDVEEGSCRGIRYQPVPNTDFSFIDRFRYVPAGNRYHLYRTASGYPGFRSMREYEFYYELCLSQNGTYSLGQGAAVGFGGRVFVRYNFQPRANQPAIIDFTQFSSNDDGSYGDFLGTATQTITLTDYNTFVFLTTCWTDTDQKGWDVFSLTPELSASARRMIEQHALSLGFSRDEFVYLKYDSCEAPASRFITNPRPPKQSPRKMSDLKRESSANHNYDRNVPNVNSGWSA